MTKMTLQKLYLGNWMTIDKWTRGNTRNALRVYAESMCRGEKGPAIVDITTTMRCVIGSKDNVDDFCDAT